MLTPEYRRRAFFDLESIAIYLGEVQGEISAAKQIFEEIAEAVARLCEMPTLGKPIVDDTFDFQGYRMYLVGNYRIFYTADEGKLVVWRIIHVRQDIDDFAPISF